MIYYTHIYMYVSIVGKHYVYLPLKVFEMLHVFDSIFLNTYLPKLLALTKITLVFNYSFMNKLCCVVTISVALSRYVHRVCQARDIPAGKPHLSSLNYFALE